ncbi:MAG: amidase [Alphaproteobacteria bacterium]|nr:amidase [Alphaproteobacteria bacterium]
MTDLCHLPALEHKRLLDSGALSSLELVDAQIARITRSNPGINAFVTLDAEQARDEARRKDDERARGSAEGVLHGLTVGVKDCFATRGIRTTWGSRAFARHVPDHDHLVVERERRAGAIILGKLNTPEFTMARNTCDNPVFGATRNPWDTRLCPGASSGGSAAALSAGMVSLADGSDIGGSLRNPAAWCNVVGHRPTSWMVPDVPNPLYWHNMNSPGPMARTVADATLFLSALAGPDPRSPVVVAPPFPAGPVDLAIDLSGLRIGWSCDHGSLDIDPSIRGTFMTALDVFSGLGVRLTRCDIDVGGVSDMSQRLSEQRLARDVGAVSDPGVDPVLMRRAGTAETMTGRDILEAEACRHRVWADLVRAFQDHDVLLWPDDLCDAIGFDDEVAGDLVDWTLLYVSPLVGLPTTTVPCGFSDSGIPRGLQVIAPPGRDRLALQVAFAFEQATGFTRRLPPI